MIGYLRFGLAGHFFSVRKTPAKAAIDRMFRNLRSSKATKAHDLFRVIGQTHAGATYSAVCFPYERSPSFLDPDANIRELVYGFLMLIEKDGLIAIFKSGLELPARFQTEYLVPLESERVERAVARHDAIFEKITLKNMSVVKQALISKTLEARDLEYNVSTSSASRFVPQHFKIRRPDGHYSTTPSTGRISIRSNRENYLMIVAWAVDIIDTLTIDTNVPADFLRGFARQVKLASVATTLQPMLVAVDVAALTTLFLGDDASFRLVRALGDGWIELEKNEVEIVLAALEDSMPVRNVPNGLELVNPNDNSRLALLRINTKRISLPGLNITIAQGISIESFSTPLGLDPDRQHLMRYIERNQLFIVLFSDFSLSYINGQLYRDEGMLSGGEVLLSRLQTRHELIKANDEKGKLTVGQQKFAKHSVFRIIVDHIAKGEVLICDDLGDEWADFISIGTVHPPANISFYHAKHDKLSLSARNFHESVGQAIKNLGRISLPPLAVQKKWDSWLKVYNGPKVVTAIKPIVRGGRRAAVEKKISAARGAPDLIQRVYIVTSGLSRSEVQQVFTALRAGRPPQAYFVQLYWLLTSFFTACSEVGAVGYVICRP